MNEHKDANAPWPDGKWQAGGTSWPRRERPSCELTWAHSGTVWPTSDLRGKKPLPLQHHTEKRMKSPYSYPGRL
jgi:hypothetical protein